MFKPLKILYPLLLCFLLNILNHNDLWVGILNCFNLGLLLISYQRLANKKVYLIRTPLLVLLGIIPLFNHHFKDPNIVFFAIGIEILLIVYSKLRFNPIFVVIIGVYLVIAGLYAGEIIKFPLIFDNQRLIINDHNANLTISQMQEEALYMPYTLRLITFNSSVYIYVILSKTAELFMIKNLYDVLLIANIYPLFLGMALGLKNWDKQRLLMFLSILLISFTIVSSRSIDIFQTFLLLSPFLIYFLLEGFRFMNQKIYFLLFVLGLLIVTSPLK